LGGGGGPNSDDWRKSVALCQLCYSDKQKTQTTFRKFFTFDNIKWPKNILNEKLFALFNFEFSVVFAPSSTSHHAVFGSSYLSSLYS
jgi:hypothetical protein